MCRALLIVVYIILLLGFAALAFLGSILELIDKLRERKKPRDA